MFVIHYNQVNQVSINYNVWRNTKRKVCLLSPVHDAFITVQWKILCNELERKLTIFGVHSLMSSDAVLSLLVIIPVLQWQWLFHTGKSQTNALLLKCVTVCIHNSEQWRPWRRGWEVQLPVQTTAASPESLCQKHPLCYFLNVCLHVCLYVCMCAHVCASNIPSGKI